MMKSALGVSKTQIRVVKFAPSISKFYSVEFMCKVLSQISSSRCARCLLLPIARVACLAEPSPVLAVLALPLVAGSDPNGWIRPALVSSMLQNACCKCFRCFKCYVS
jgi:hypothetical protein